MNTLEFWLPTMQKFDLEIVAKGWEKREREERRKR